MDSDLFAQLVSAKLAGTKIDGEQKEGRGGYIFHSNEGAAKEAIRVVLEWLLNEAASFGDCPESFVILDLAEKLDPKIKDSFPLDPVLKALNDKRISLGWTQKDLARHSGTTQSAISDLLTGKASPTLTTLRKVAASLGMDVELSEDI